MFLFDFILLAAGLFAIYLGVVVAIRSGRLPVHRAFTFFAVNLGLWSVCLALLEQTEEPMFEHLSFLFATLGLLALPLFVYNFPRYNWPRWWLWLIYVPAIPLVVLSPTSYFISEIQFNQGTVRPIPGPSFDILMIILGFYFTLSLIVYLWRYYQNKDNDKLRLQYVGAGLVIFLMIGSIGMLLLPFFDSYDYLITAPMAGFLVLLTLSTLAVLKQELIDIRIIVTEVIVFLAAGLVLTNNLMQATTNLEYMSSGFLLATFLFTAARLVSIIVGVLRQRRALKVANAKMKDLMEMKDEFLQIASHQLRAPLTALRGLIEMQATGYFDDLAADKVQEFRKEMSGAANRLYELVNDLLRSLKMEGNKLPLEFGEVDLVKLINEAVETLKTNYDKRQLKLEFQAPEVGFPVIEGDKEYLRQILINLIDNAEHYTKTGGTTVTLKQDGDAVVIDVTDTGIGITKEEMAKLFQKFARAARAQEFRHEGTGLGLFIARKIAESHNGSLSLASEGENKGTTAEVKLPIKQPAQSKQAETESDVANETAKTQSAG